MESRQDGHGKTPERFRHGILLASTQRLPHSQDQRPTVRDDRGVVHEDRIRAPRLWILLVAHVDATLSEQVRERVVLSLGLGQVRLPRVAPSLRIRHRERGVGSSHEHGAERVRHALASTDARHVRPRSGKRCGPLTLCPARRLRSNKGSAFRSSRGSRVVIEGGQTTLYFGPWYRKSPFFAAAQRAGCYGYDLYNKMYIPSNFADPVEEYWHLVNEVTVWDVGCERQVEIKGPDGHEFMEFLTPRDLSTCKVGQAKYVVLTDEQGGIVNDPVLIRLEKDRFWLSTADSDVLLWAKGVAYHSDLDVEIEEPDVSPMQIQGPKSKDLLNALVGPRVLDLAYYHFLHAKIDGIPVLVTRTGWSAEVGYEIYLRDGSRGTDLWERVMGAGKRFHLRPTGPSDRKSVV